MAIIKSPPTFLSDPTVLNRESFALGFTQSEMGTWDDCPEKWYRGYNQMLRLKGTFAWYFVYGDAFHRTLQNYYRSGDQEVASLQFSDDIILTADQQADRDKWQRILEVQMRRYFIYYQDDLLAWDIFLNEEIVELDFEGIKLTGKLDLGFTLKGRTGGATLVDHKSASRFSMDALLGWDFRFQFMYYIWLAQKVSGRKITEFVVNGLKKPALKQGVKESLDSYIVRIEQDMIQRPEEYFKRQNLAMIANSMEHFEERVLRPKLDRIKLLTQEGTPATIIESLVRNQNTNNCVKYGAACQFLPMCQHGAKREMFRYVTRETKHEELSEE